LTHVGHIDESTIALAIQREFSRGGQIFFVLNRIDQLQEWMKKIKDKFPNLKFGLLHGQLPTNQIEDTMQKVWDGKVDILFATTIVEAGIDLPKVNTLITVNSELLGMSQLYQLKGRVGRRGEQSFAYFFHSKNLSVDAEMRLYAIRSIGETSTGYSLAMKDLQLRGSGSILGDIQSGFIANVGLNIFNKYVLEAIERKTEKQISPPSNDLKLDTFWGASLPKSYINADSERLDIYKRLEGASIDEADLIYEELHDRFGEVPLVSKNLITTAKIRNILIQKNILKTIIKDKSIEIFPIDLTESINTKLKEIDKKFIFRNKRLVLNFKIALTPNNTYEVIRSIL
jgi:transcription-repair coupling factor (superfamily II helicase)